MSTLAILDCTKQENILLFVPIKPVKLETSHTAILSSVLNVLCLKVNTNRMVQIEFHSNYAFASVWKHLLIIRKCLFKNTFSLSHPFP